MKEYSLSEVIKLQRRYLRSVNLERDLQREDSLVGYVPTPRALEALQRVAAALDGGTSQRAWTVTGVYGTGKSAFALLLADCLGPSRPRLAAMRALESQPGTGNIRRRLKRSVPAEGFVRAVAVARREPLSCTVLRALATGAEAFWAGKRGRRPSVVDECVNRASALSSGRVNTDGLPELARRLAQASGTGLLIVIDEMGKNLEAAARSGGADELYLLQQLAELPSTAGEPPVLVVGLLHQAFVEYGSALTATERTEWDKIQGRFEELTFAEAPEQMLRLMGAALEPDLAPSLSRQVRRAALEWRTWLSAKVSGSAFIDQITPEQLESLYPLHPIAALILPGLCARYAQNERSLFSFLTSPTPHSLATFLAENNVGPNRLPFLRLPDVFDYFFDSGAPASRLQFQRWTEVQATIRDASGVTSDEREALKAIGTLNLVGSGGPLRASRDLVVAALSERVSDASWRHWRGVLSGLVERRLVAYRSRVDEFRLWEGSDYDVEASVQSRMEADRRALSPLLQSVASMDGLVAPRHSYQRGTLRYFERQYADATTDLDALNCVDRSSDGLLVYWVGAEAPTPATWVLPDGRPLAVIRAKSTHAVEGAARELAALSKLEAEDPALGRDGVARREVKQRIVIARRALADSLLDAFSGSQAVSGVQTLSRQLTRALSDLCDQAYPLAPTLWNEMLNRRELTSQGARARRELIQGMLQFGAQERLRLQGDGPEYAMYASTLLSTGMHRSDGANGWEFGRPSEPTLQPAWDAVEAYCLSSAATAKPLSDLYDILERPPFGIKAGIVPVVLAAVLLYHADDVSVYKDGTFVPQLGPEHFELLVKDPARFAVKHLALQGLRLEVFRDLAADLVTGARRTSANGVRNATLLGVVRPLVRFATTLPQVTRRAVDLAPEALAVRDALLTATEPDRLLFEDLPNALNRQPFLETGPGINSERLRGYRSALFQAIRELQGYYDGVLDRCRLLIHEAFGVRSDPGKLREDLSVRSTYLRGRCVDPVLKRLTVAATESGIDDRAWLESLVMVVADRPADTWSSEDVLTFELNLAEVARRFSRLEALLREAGATPHEGFDARRIALTNSDGRELQRIVWVDRAQREKILTHAHKLSEEIHGLREPHLREAVALALLDEILGDAGAAVPLDHAHETTNDSVTRRKRG